MVQIVDVICYNGDINLVVRTPKATQHVMRVMPRGLRMAEPGVAREVLKLHEVEVLQFQQVASGG